MKKSSVTEIIEQSIEAKRSMLDDEALLDSVLAAAGLMRDTLKAGGRILSFGNGGSASDSQHLAAELVVRFEKDRKALPCVSLCVDPSVVTAAGNDFSFDDIFSRQVEALAGEGDVVFAISTSGTSTNVLKAVGAAKSGGARVIALTGKAGSPLSGEADISIDVNAPSTARVQEAHILIIHIICRLIEDGFDDR